MVLLDWLMPGMDGLQVLAAVVADAPVAQRHAFILLTALDTSPRLRTTFPPDLSVTVIGKPFELDAFLDAVAHAAQGLPR